MLQHVNIFKNSSANTTICKTLTFISCNKTRSIKMFLIAPIVCGAISGHLGFNVPDVEWLIISLPWWLLAVVINYNLK